MPRKSPTPEEAAFFEYMVFVLNTLKRPMYVSVDAMKKDEKSNDYDTLVLYISVDKEKMVKHAQEESVEMETIDPQDNYRATTKYKFVRILILSEEDNVFDAQYCNYAENKMTAIALIKKTQDLTNLN